MSTEAYENFQTNGLTDTCIKNAVNMLVNIVETACEHEADLELMRMVNFIDLYRTYLSRIVLANESVYESETLGADSNTPVPALGVSNAVSFEQFISDSRLLHIAAAAASKECGFAVATPPPLKMSANGATA